MKIVFLKGVLLLLICSLCPDVKGQNDADKDLRIEIEPASFVLRGFAGSISYNLAEDNKLNLGLYAATLDIPDQLRPNIFEGVGHSDTSSARLGFQLALNARYRIQLFDQFESNPYVGFILGWEYFDILQPGYEEKVRLSTFLSTLYLGYEIYFFHQLLYLNPQLRGVIYFLGKSSDETRQEQLQNFLFLPQVSLGIRL